MLFIEKSPWPTLTLIVSLEAIFLSTFVMIGQNRQAAFPTAEGRQRLLERGQAAGTEHGTDPPSARVDEGAAPARSRQLNWAGLQQRSELEPGTGKEPGQQPGAVLHSFQPGLHQRSARPWPCWCGHPHHRGPAAPAPGASLRRPQPPRPGTSSSSIRTTSPPGSGPVMAWTYL